MKTLLRAFLPLALLLAAVTPAAAVDETPAPDTTSVAPDGVLYAVRGYAGALPITTSEEAHAAVLAAGAPFAEFVPLTDDLIGADSWYQAKGEAGSDAPWAVVYTYGWGDCSAGCISTHTFTYLIDPLTGAATLDSHQGDALPADAPAALIELTGRSGGVVPEPEWRTVTGEPTACPEGITDPSAPISSDTVLPCLLPDGSLFPIVVEDGVDGDTDWATMYNTWMEEFRASLEPCAADVDLTDPGLTACLLPDGTAVGAMPLFAMNMAGSNEEEGGWTTTLPAAILAALLAWIGVAVLVGRSKRRTLR
jgi:hypothetical protein